jgi:tRNA threonylcarbamoyl adenosine modification protein YeaZ
MELAIDTSTGFAGVALSDNGVLLAEHLWRSNQNHTRELSLQIENLLNQKHIAMKDIKVVFVARGPGSFNGLRVGISTAKGLAFALKIPLVSISTLEMEAFPFAYTGLPISAVHNGGRGEIAVALYRQGRTWKCLEPEKLVTVEMLCQQTVKKTLFCGEIPEAAFPELKAKLGTKAVIPSQVARQRHPGYLSELGWLRWQKGEQDDIAALQPIYMRQPPITQRKDRIIKK